MFFKNNEIVRETYANSRKTCAFYKSLVDDGVLAHHIIYHP
jgi:hypothetical protein